MNAASLGLPGDVVGWLDRPDLEAMQVACLSLGALSGQSLDAFKELLASRSDRRSLEILSILDSAR